MKLQKLSLEYLHKRDERLVVINSETTGVSVEKGAKLIEISAVEIIGTKVTGKYFHEYINPEVTIPDIAVEVHGITNEYLETIEAPCFSEIANELLSFIDGAKIVAHYAPFDIGFLNHEFSLINTTHEPFEKRFDIFDSLEYFQKLYPDVPNDLDALCKRYDIGYEDNPKYSNMSGALLDARILAEILTVAKVC